MAQFYKELKELRISQDIRLEDLEEKTKINIRYLKSIENGDFNILPIPYLRLFLRAYASEIGGDPEKVLDQLDSFYGTSKPKLAPQNKEQDRTITNNSIRIKDVLSIPNIKLRKDYITGSALVIGFLFSLMVIKKVINEDSVVSNDSSQFILNTESSLINNKNLITNFRVEKHTNELLSISNTPPFFVTIKSEKNNYVKVKLDSINEYSKNIDPGLEIEIPGFVSSGEFLFPNSDKLSFRINGNLIKQIKDYKSPIRITIKSNPQSIVIHWYKPIA